MAYTSPTAADVKARWPQFAAVEDTSIDGALDEAALFVDDTWPSQAIFTQAMLLYAAHTLTSEGLGMGPEAEAFAGGGLKVEQSGDTKFEYFAAKTADASGSNELSATSFGRRFKTLRRMAKAGPRLIRGDGGLLDTPDGFC